MIDSLIAFLSQDISGLLVNVFFAYTIILMIRDPQKPPVQTSILTGLALIVLSFGSFVAVAPSIMSAVNGGLWLYLGYQRWCKENDSTT